MFSAEGISTDSQGLLYEKAGYFLLSYYVYVSTILVVPCIQCLVNLSHMTINESQKLEESIINF